MRGHICESLEDNRGNLQQINDSMIKIILRMCAPDEDRIIFRACNLTPLSQKLGSDQR